MSHTPFRIAKVNTDAIAGNVKRLFEITGVDDVMVVVKANAYGHGMVPAAKAALAGGATWLGTADIAEALNLREAGITAPVLCWIHAPDETFDEAVAADITLGAVSVAQLNAIAAAGHRNKATPRVHLKLDTGLSRNGAIVSVGRAICLGLRLGQAHIGDRLGRPPPSAGPARRSVRRGAACRGLQAAACRARRGGAHHPRGA